MAGSTWVLPTPKPATATRKVLELVEAIIFSPQGGVQSDETGLAPAHP